MDSVSVTDHFNPTHDRNSLKILSELFSFSDMLWITTWVIRCHLGWLSYIFYVYIISLKHLSTYHLDGDRKLSTHQPTSKPTCGIVVEKTLMWHKLLWLVNVILHGKNPAHLFPVQFLLVYMYIKNIIKCLQY